MALIEIPQSLHASTVASQTGLTHSGRVRPVRIVARGLLRRRDAHQAQWSSDRRRNEIL